MKQRIYSYFLSIVLLVGCLLPALTVRADNPPAGDNVVTDQTTDGGPGAVVTFTNAPDETPYLEIQKKLNVAENVELPEEVRDTLFHFYVEVQDDKGIYRPHANKDYSVTDTESGSAENENERKNTGANGIVELKAGQTARFDYVGQGKTCRITEIELPEGFMCASPADGVTVKTIGANGAAAIFENTYVGLLPAKDGALTVQKKVSYPQGYEYGGTEDFGFTLLVDGKAAKSEVYTLRDTENGVDIPGIQKTDDKGHFTLKAGQAAVFGELPGKVDYKVTEDPCPEGWHSVGKNSFEGSTSDHGTVTFTNTNTAFAVEKRLVNWADDTTEFTFELFDGQGRTWADAEYMLYSATSGKRINRDVSGNDITDTSVTYRTGADGRFQLKAGEAAVFVGIPAKTGYSVKEVAEGEEYVQQTPVSVEGYQNRSVSEAGDEILPFYNARLERKGAVTVTKQLEYTSQGEAPLQGAEKEFTFRISRIDTVSGNDPQGSAETYFNKVTYTKGTDGKPYTTDENGVFTLKAGETAVFAGQFFNRTYKVEELDIDEMPGYSIEEGKRTLTKVLEDDSMASFVFRNEYTARHYDLELFKVDTTKEEGEQALAGAQFMLYTDEACKHSYNGSEEPFVTGADGKVTLPNLREGTYYLKEVAAPRGYRVMVEPVVLTVKRVLDDNGNEVLEVETADTADEVIASVWSKDSLTAADDPTTAHDKLALTIKNDKGRLYNLPATGGPGTAGFAIIGILLMAAAAVLVIRSRKQKA